MPSGSPKYTDPDELQKKVDEYFEYTKGELNPQWPGIESTMACDARKS